VASLQSLVKGQLDDCLIVGVGASAGGLEAISELLAAIPRDSGIAFLIVQHLAPKRPSLLSTLLASRCLIRVVEGAENMVIEAGHVYVIPPNTSMSVAAGRIVLSRREDETKEATP
jgi:two-component system CheB/CheR fusion protein